MPEPPTRRRGGVIAIPLIIGHRGYPERFPDNSLGGIEAALAAGADGVEVDVRPSREGVWVCHHNRDRSGRSIAEWETGALRRDGVPTLAETVEAIPADRWLFVEIKPLPIARLEALAEPVARLIEGRGGRTKVLSSSPAILAWFGILLPATPRSLVFDRLPVTGFDGLELSPKHTLIERLGTAGTPLNPWTVNRPARMRALAQLGVASITTNRAPRAVEVLHG